MIIYLSNRVSSKILFTIKPKKMTKKIAMLLIVCLLSGSIFAQKVTKDENGNYIAAVSKRGGQPKETGKTYTDTSVLHQGIQKNRQGIQILSN